MVDYECTCQRAEHEVAAYPAAWRLRSKTTEGNWTINDVEVFERQ